MSVELVKYIVLHITPLNKWRPQQIALRVHKLLMAASHAEDSGVRAAASA